MRTHLKDQETVAFVTRQHWLVLLIPGLLSAAVITGGILLGDLGLLAIPVAAIYFTYRFFDRRFNLWAVTNLRVIDEYGLLSSNSKESPLDKINNVSYRQSLMGRLLGYGNVEIQTAAEAGATVYAFVAKPRDLKDSITRMQEEQRLQLINLQAGRLADALAQGQPAGRIDVPSELERLFELKQRGIITEEEFQTRKTRLLNT